jgi:tyrosine aminotransferase
MDNGDMEIIVDGNKWKIAASRGARNTINPIRRIVDRCQLMPNPDKPMISLSIGKV